MTKPKDEQMVALLPDAPPKKAPRNKTPQEMPTDELVKLLAPEGPQPSARFCRNIAKAGVLEPILLEQNGSLFKLHDGRRRILAADRAGFKTVPVEIMDGETMKTRADRDLPRGTSAAGLVMTLSTNYHRSQNPVEELRALEQLITAKHSPEHIAEQTDIPLGQIRRRLKLLKLIPALRAGWEAGAFALNVAEACARISSRQQAKLAKILAEEETVTLADVRGMREAAKKTASAALPESMFKDPVQRGEQATRGQIAGLIYRFGAWLTQQADPITVGKDHHAAPMAERVDQFLKGELGITEETDFTLLERLQGVRS